MEAHDASEDDRIALLLPRDRKLTSSKGTMDSFRMVEGSWPRQTPPNFAIMIDLEKHLGKLSAGFGHCCKPSLLVISYPPPLFPVPCRLRLSHLYAQLLICLSPCSRLGWFFEWPGGRHPLNTTWPWADVKPSLVVLWGVCWMFAIDPRRRVNALSNDRYYAPPNHHQVARNTHQVQHPPQYSHRPHRPDPNMHPMNQQSWHELSGFRRFEPSHRFGT